MQIAAGSKRTESQALGILAGIATGFFWGFAFLVPQLLSHYSSFEVSAGRFFFFAAFSVVGIRSVVKLLKSFDSRELFEVFLLSFTGFSGYTLLLFWSVPRAGGVISALLVGLLPVTISLYGPRAGALSTRFFAGLFLIAAGLVTLVFGINGGLGSVDPLGVLGSIICLGSWTWFAIRNSRFLKAHPRVDPRVLSGVMGVLGASLVLPVWAVVRDSQAVPLTQRPDFTHFIFWSLILGGGASWLANWLWNICSRLCPPQISGPLIVSETIFGLLYTFLYQKRWPTAFETAAIVLCVTGVFICVRSEVMRSRLSPKH